MIAVVDYGRGNLFSLGRALAHVGAEHCVTARGEDLLAADAIVLPGVGAFGDAMTALAERELVAPLREAANRGTPLLGICLGMQVFARVGEEYGRYEGLALIEANVRRLPEPKADDPVATRIPNVGWRVLHVQREDPVLFGLDQSPAMYFVHSYGVFTDTLDNVVATIRVNGDDVPAIVRRANVVGCQFHPERSGPAGLALLANFVELVKTQQRTSEVNVRASL